MPEIRPGRAYYFTADLAVAHGAPVHRNGYVGIAIKKTAAPAGTGLGASVITTIQAGEAAHMETEGRALVNNSRQEGGTFAKGDAVNIRTADNLLTAAAVGAGVVAFGRVAEIAGERGVPTGKMRVDLAGARVV